jgi:hypothetical protein
LDVPNSSPITYMANGKQYVALTVGNGGAHAATFPPLVPEIQNPPDGGAMIWVLELDVRFHESCHNGGIHLGFSDSHIGRVNP